MIYALRWNCFNASKKRLPDAVFKSKALKQVTLRTKTMKGQYINNKGQVEPWKAHYDKYGRIKALTDYNAGNKARGVPDTYHTYEW